MIKFRAVITAALFIFVSLAPATGQDVTLTSHDGTIAVDGILLGYDGEFYRIKTLYGALTIAGAGVNCAGPGCPDLNTYVAKMAITGARRIGDRLLPSLIENFARLNAMTVRRVVRSDSRFMYVLRQIDSGRTLAEISFRIGSTDSGFADLLADDADMVMATRELHPAEAAQARAAGLGRLDAPQRRNIIGLDALVPVVAQTNPLSGLSLETLAQVFSGKINNWQALGGLNAKITLHLRGAGSGQLQIFRRRVMAPLGLMLAKNVVWHGSAADVVAAVAADPFAIGIASYAEIGNARALPLKGTCGFLFEATGLTLKTGDYPLTTPLFLYTQARRLPKIARDFLRYLHTDAAQRAIAHSGFVDSRPVVISLGAQGARLANAISAAGSETSLKDLQGLIAAMRSARRLSVTFRFDPGSSRMDAQSQANVVYLARLLEAGAYRGRQMVFVGFSDSNGPAAANLRISLKRAVATEAAVLKEAATANLSRLTFDAAGFGEAMPMACDDEAWGRRVNRRVEVWLR